MNLKPYNLPPETTSPLLRSQCGSVPRGSAPQDSTVVYMPQWVCASVCVYMSKTEMYSCLLVQFTNSSQLFKIITKCHRKDRHTHTCIEKATWTGLAHTTFYTNVGDKSSVIECASVQLFSSPNSLLIVTARTCIHRFRKNHTRLSLTRISCSSRHSNVFYCL